MLSGKTATQPQPIYLKDYIPPAFQITSIALRFELAETHTLVHNKMVIARTDSSTKGPLILNGEYLELIAVILEGQLLTSADYQITPESLVFSAVPNHFTLEITTRIQPQNNTALEGLYKSGPIFCTQCEPQGFRRITYFLDRPDVLTQFTTTLVADKTRYPILLCNGNPIAQGQLENNQHWVTWQDPFKKPCYLFALVAGDLDVVEDYFIARSGRKITLRIYVDKGNLDKTPHAMQCVKQSMHWDEQAFGREYDLDIFMIVAIHDFNMGAMENKGLNIFNAKYILANPQIATDVDYDNILSVVGHEYFHNWSGNRVTCRDWFQLSLKEGLTIFREQEFFAEMTSQAVARIEDVHFMWNKQFPEDAGPLAHAVQPGSYIEINNFYTATVYHKGAEVIRMLQTLLGKALFRKAMDLYFLRYDGQAVTIEELVCSMEAVSGCDLSQFRLWYHQAGTPQLTINYHYHAEQKTFTLLVEQSCPPTPGQLEKKPLHLPLVMALLNEQGQELNLRLRGEATTVVDKTKVLQIRNKREQYEFIEVPVKCVPSLLRNFSAPVKLQVNYSDADYLFLLKHEQQGFNRWEAGYRLVLRRMLQLVETAQSHQPLQFDDALVTVWRDLLHETQTDKALLAAMLSLPEEIELAEATSVIDVDAIHQVYRDTSRYIAEKLQVDFLRCYGQLDNYLKQERIDAKAARRLKNLCLRYLALTENPAMCRLCVTQYQAAVNMTDRLAALSALRDVACEQRTHLLQDFYQRWQHESTVMDKWLTLQATADLPDSLQTVRHLLHHPAFTIKNPNKVYALLGAFARNNLAHFHMVNGDGYQLITDQVLYLDKNNPIVAARLLEPFTKWRKLVGKRQALMRQQLERIMQTPPTSKDVYEVVSKSLA